MAHSPNDWLEIYRVVLGAMVKHPHCSAACFAAVFVLIWWVITGGLGNQEHTWKRPHGRLFPTSAVVYDVYNGSLEAMRDLMSNQQLHFVAFYAPWSADSRDLIPEFFMAAKHLKKRQVMVIFVAINCWIGSCRANYTFSSFPRLYGYYTKSKPVEYHGPLDRYKMVKFLHSMLRPFSFITQSDQLSTFLNSQEVVVLGFYKWPFNLLKDKKYTVFFDVCLSSVNRVNGVAFGLITKGEIAELVHMKSHGDLLIHSLLNKIVVYPEKSNYTVDAILGWIYNHSKKVVMELTPNSTDLDFYRHQLQKGAAILLFVPSRSKGRKQTLSAYGSTALMYNNCTCSDESPEKIESSPFLPSNDSGESVKVQRERVCISSTRSLRTDQPFCHFEICQLCRHHCPLQVQTPIPFFHSERGLSYQRSCHRDRHCSSLRTGDYYGNTMVEVCHFKGNSLGRSNQSELEDIENDPEVKSLISLLKNLQVVLSSSFQQMDTLSALDIRRHIKALKNKDRSIDSSPQTMHSLNETGTSKSNSTGQQTHCNSSLASHFIEQLKHNTSTNFPGLKCRTNRTLNFFHLDSDRYFFIAEKLGINQSKLLERKTALAIVDIKTEASYVFPEHRKIEKSSLVEFIVNYTLGTLKRKLRSSSPQARRVCFQDKRGLFCYIEVSSESFEETVLDEDKDVFLLYHAPWCGHCKLPNHLLMQLANLLRGVKSLVLARIDADKNDLPYEYTVDGFPNFVLFPAKSKDDSVPYPDHSLTLENMILFLSKHSSQETRSKLRGLVGARG